MLFTRAWKEARAPAINQLFSARLYLVGPYHKELLQRAGILPYKNQSLRMYAASLHHILPGSNLRGSYIHKCDAGAVKTNVKNEKELQDSFKEIIGNVKRYNEQVDIKKDVLVQEMVKEGKETVIGAKTEPGFGLLVMFGMGGIYVQFMKDVVSRLPR